MQIVIDALAQYGAAINDDGNIVRNGKILPVIVKVKGNRVRFENADGYAHCSGPLAEQTVCRFVEHFWYWSK